MQTKFRPQFTTVLATLFVFTLISCNIVRADTPLELSMQKMGKAFKELTLDLNQPVETDKDKYIALATTVKTEAIKARDMVPKKAENLPADQKGQMIKGYQEQMDKMLASVDSLIANLQSGQFDEAKKVVLEIKSEMRTGHKDFRKKE